MRKTWKDDLYVDVIKHLVKDKEELEERLNLPEGLRFIKEHPRFGELLAVCPNISTKGLFIF
jgi:hypothetical protein